MIDLLDAKEKLLVWSLDEDAIHCDTCSRSLRLMLISVSDSQIVYYDLCVISCGFRGMDQACHLRARVSMSVLRKPANTLVIRTGAYQVGQVGIHIIFMVAPLHWRCPSGNHGHVVDFAQRYWHIFLVPVVRSSQGDAVDDYGPSILRLGH